MEQSPKHIGLQRSIISFRSIPPSNAVNKKPRSWLKFDSFRQGMGEYDLFVGEDFDSVTGKGEGVGIYPDQMIYGDFQVKTPHGEIRE